ncbi:MAG: cupin domain-containing protein [Pseudomonadota bacterium]|nr:cupin domain-containing protein [Pseudomonadota bacterium]
MDIALPSPLLGGLSSAAFMRRHWQKKPLLVRAALPDAPNIVDRGALFELAAHDDVESRLVERHVERNSQRIVGPTSGRDVDHAAERWSLRHGPFTRRSLPGLKGRAWTLLVQGADLHLEAAHRLLRRFAFVPAARLDDVMLSFATDGGGVGPHIDSYDVFLLQVRGRRRWKIGKVKAPVLRQDAPLKLLADFAPSAEWLLEPGDMLYLPPGWAHDGVAEGETITASIGFRAAGVESLGAGVVQHLLDAFEAPDAEALYSDPRQEATAEPARIPVALQRCAEASVKRLLDDRIALGRALGEALSEPKPRVWFEPGSAPAEPTAVRLDRRTRMLYDDRHVFINGDACRAAGRDAKLVRRLADRGVLDRAEIAALSVEARALVDEWIESGWLVAAPDRIPEPLPDQEDSA